MADIQDRGDNSGGTFVLGLLAGAVLGAGLGMLFAPKAGAKLRKQLFERAGELANQAQKGYHKVTEDAGQWAERGKEAAGEWTELGKDMVGEARDTVARGADEAQKYVRDAVDTVKVAVGSRLS